MKNARSDKRMKNTSKFISLILRHKPEVIGISLGEHLVYAVVYAGTKLNVISTRQLRQYDYRGTQDPSGTALVYGWQ